MLETVHERMNEELEETWAAVEAAAAPAPPDDDVDVESIESPFKIAADQSNTIWVQSWLREERQRSDPAFFVGHLFSFQLLFLPTQQDFEHRLCTH